MKRKIFNASQLLDIRKRINDAMKDEGKELAEALRSLLDQLENAEEDVSVDALKSEILAIVNENAEVPAKVAEQIANAVADINKRVANAVVGGAKSAQLSKEVKNEICGAILGARGKDEVKNAVNAVLVKNGIEGLAFADVVDYTIVENWGNFNPLFSQLHETKVSKFFYSSQDMKNAEILAKQWDKKGETTKKIQQITAKGKKIDTQYVYKIQEVEQEDLDEVTAVGEQTNFLRWLNEELDRMIVNTIIMAILVGDAVNEEDDRVTTFETIGTKTVNDVFTSVLHPEGNTVTLADLRRTADAVKNPNGKKKVMVMSTTMLTNVATFKYAAGGTEVFHKTEDVARMIGVDEIVVIDLVDENDGLYAICMLPDGYWYKQKNYISVAYAEWKKNRHSYQKERNIGGAIHDLFSTAVLKASAEVLKASAEVVADEAEE